MSHSAFIIFDIISSQRVLPFDIMSCLAFITFNIISSRIFSLFDILSRSAFITFVLMAFGHYLPFDVLCFRRFFTIQRFFHRPFVSFDVLSVDVFYPWRFLLRHFVGESRCRRHFLVLFLEMGTAGGSAAVSRLSKVAVVNLKKNLKL
jgi:hypothetical protein